MGLVNSAIHASTRKQNSRLETVQIRTETTGNPLLRYPVKRLMTASLNSGYNRNHGDAHEAAAGIWVALWVDLLGKSGRNLRKIKSRVIPGSHTLAIVTAALGGAVRGGSPEWCVLKVEIALGHAEASLHGRNGEFPTYRVRQTQ